MRWISLWRFPVICTAIWYLNKKNSLFQRQFFHEKWTAIPESDSMISELEDGVVELGESGIISALKANYFNHLESVKNGKNQLVVFLSATTVFNEILMMEIRYPNDKDSGFVIFKSDKKELLPFFEESFFYIINQNLKII